MALRRTSSESWILPPGWKFLSTYDEHNYEIMMNTAYKKIIKTPQDEQMMAEGNLVFLTRAGENGKLIDFLIKIHVDLSTLIYNIFFRSR